MALGFSDIDGSGQGARVLICTSIEGVGEAVRAVARLEGAEAVIEIEAGKLSTALAGAPAHLLVLGADVEAGDVTQALRRGEMGALARAAGVIVTGPDLGPVPIRELGEAGVDQCVRFPFLPRDLVRAASAALINRAERAAQSGGDDFAILD